MSWPAAGLPEALHLDNATEFKAEALERGAREYGVQRIRSTNLTITHKFSGGTRVAV